MRTAGGCGARQRTPALGHASSPEPSALSPTFYPTLTQPYPSLRLDTVPAGGAGDAPGPGGAGLGARVRGRLPRERAAAGRAGLQRGRVPAHRQAAALHRRRLRAQHGCGRWGARWGRAVGPCGGAVRDPVSHQIGIEWRTRSASSRNWRQAACWHAFGRSRAVAEGSPSLLGCARSEDAEALCGAGQARTTWATSCWPTCCWRTSRRRRRGR
jgi:hypothetical protein